MKTTTTCTVVPDAKKPCLKPTPEAASAAEIQRECSTEQLRATISNMDWLAQDGFSTIANIAKLALAALENPRTCNDHESLALALESIFKKALSAEDSINSNAEERGCNYVDEAERRRWAARRKANEQG